jgi:hypothetical protein
LPLQVALPELDGALEPIVFAGRDSNTGKSHSLPDRIESLAERAINWASLRKKKNADKKLAITVFSFPPDKGNVGTAAYLNVFGSIFAVLKNLKACGYDVGSLPNNEMDLIQVSGGTGRAAAATVLCWGVQSKAGCSDGRGATAMLLLGLTTAACASGECCCGLLAADAVRCLIVMRSQLFARQLVMCAGGSPSCKHSSTCPACLCPAPLPSPCSLC